MTGAVGSQAGIGYYADWHGNVTGVYSDLPTALDDVLDNSRLADHPAARFLTDGVDDAFERLTARMNPMAGSDGVDQPGAAPAQLRDRKKLEERLFGLDLTCSCPMCARPAVSCICGMFAALAPKLKAPSPPAAAEPGPTSPSASASA